jgi:hypothetical protein
LSGRRERETEERDSEKKYIPEMSSRHLISKEWAGTASEDDKSLQIACDGVAFVFTWYILLGMLAVLMNASSERTNEVMSTGPHVSPPKTINRVRLIWCELSTLKVLWGIPFWAVSLHCTALGLLVHKPEITTVIKCIIMTQRTKRVVRGRLDDYCLVGCYAAKSRRN